MIAPAVSVLMPVYNGERWLACAIESVLAQTFSDFELIVVDDGSTDGSASIIESFAQRDPRVRLVRTEHAGVVAARAVSLAEACAPLVAFLDADDEWVPRRLERQISHADERTVVFSDAYFAEGGRATGRRYSSSCPVPRLEYPLVAGLFPQLLERNFIPMLTVLAPRNLLLEAGAFRYGELRGLRTGGAEDWEMWLLLSLRGARFHYVDEPLAVYRKHVDQLTANWLRMVAAEVAVFDGLLSEVRGADSRVLRRARRRQRRKIEGACCRNAWQQVVAGDAGAARRELRQSLRLRPLSPAVWLVFALMVCPPLARGFSHARARVRVRTRLRAVIVASRRAVRAFHPGASD